MKIIDRLREDGIHISFEIFPPKTDAGYDKVIRAAEEMAGLKPEFISVTYGAGGGTSKNTAKIASYIKHDLHVESLAHLTCASSTKDEVRSVIASLKEQGIALEKLSYQIANWNRVQAQNRMMQLIGRYNNRMEVVLANNDAMALGAMDAYEKLGYTETNRPVFFGIDGTKEGLEAVKDGTLAATVYNDKEGQAAAMANLAFSIATEDENNPNPFKNYKYIYRAYQKVTKENVQTFLEKEE